MKYIKLLFFICVIQAFFAQKVNAQDNKINVSAIVLDARGDKVPGAVVSSDNNQASVVANESGEFNISVPANSLLSVKATGYKPIQVVAKSDLKAVTLNLISSDLVSVAFNKVNKADLLGGVSSLNVSKQLEDNFTTYSLDNLGSYIPGYHGNIWGMDSKLVLVDGIPRDEYNVIPSEIDQITVLKSAAAVALYGSRASKGVVSITTKRGLDKANQFKVRVNTGLSVPKRNPEYLGSAEYMTLYNEALKNDGITTGSYSEADIANYASGKNPYRYPNVDFYSSNYLKDYATRTEAIAEYTGGNDVARFYVNIGNFNTTTLLNFGNGKDEGENRFNVRGNLDIKLSNTITGKVNTSVTFYDNKTAQGSFWSNAATIRPNQFSPLIPVCYLDGSDAISNGYVNSSAFLIDGKYLLGGTSTQTTNPFADIYTRGLVKGTTRKYQFDTSLNFDLSSFLKGLSFDTQFGIDYNTSYSRTIGDNSYAVYAPNWNSAVLENDTIKSLNKIGQDNASYSQSLGNSYQRQTLFFSGAFKYNTTIEKVHNVSAMLLAHAYTLSESAVYHAVANANMGLQASYNYKQKYYADFTGNVVHSSRLAPGHREAFSPTVSLGWRISNEDFLSKTEFVNDLKITASAGILNTDIDMPSPGYYLYKTNYTDAGDYFSWVESRQLRSTISTRYINENLGFEKRKDFSLGFEASLLKNMLQVNGSYYYSKFEGIPLQVANKYPNYLVSGSTSFLQFENYNGDQRNGFDFGVNFNKRIQKVDLNVGLVGTYYETQAAKRSEIYLNSYQNRQGKALDGLWGLRNDGFYTASTVASIDGTPANPKPSYGAVKPGDLKYIDVNEDGIIDNKDEVFLGRGGWSGAPLTLGLNVTAKWNNFTLFVLANSTSGAYGFKNGSYYWATAGNTAKYSAPMRGRWTEETAAIATYPRLTTTSGDNNFRNSDFWLYKNDRINLARVQISYDIPKSVYAKSFINGLGVYVNGNDLLLIAKEKELMETNIGSTPQMRSFTFGVKATF